MLAAFTGYAFLAYVLYLLFVPAAAPQWAQASNQSFDSLIRPYEQQIRGIGVTAIGSFLLYELWTLQDNVTKIRRELAELNEKLRRRSE